MDRSIHPSHETEASRTPPSQVERSQSPPAERRSFWLVAIACGALAIWIAVTVSVTFGGETFYFRDVLTTHVPFKAFGAAELKAGRVPAFNPNWGLGQPFRGNPNTLAFYPGNLLYLVLPWWSAFNLHYCLHWLLAGFAMWFLARRLGQSPEGALMAALTYAGGGYLLSSLSFYNLLGVVAWWPLVMAAALKGGRRGIALGGVGCGLVLLCGEPVTATIALVPLLLIAIQAHGVRRGLLTCLGIGTVGLLVAAPQVVATGRILSFTVRGSGLGAALSDSSTYALNPWRLLELILPFPFGRPGDFGSTGYWSQVVTPRVPFVLTLYPGIVALGLATTVLRRRLGWTVLCSAGLVCAAVGGWGGDLLQRATAGLMRYPEKFLLWFALAVALLAGWGLERVLSRPGSFAKGAALLGVVFAIIVGTGRPLLGHDDQWSDWIENLFLPHSYPGFVDQQQAQLVIALTSLSIVLIGAALAARRRSAAGLLAAQLAGLLLLAPLLMTADRESFESSPWATFVGSGAAVVSGTLDSPFHDPPPKYRMLDTSYLARLRIAAADLDPATGILNGLSYPMAPDLEGMHSHLFGRLLARLPDLDWSGRVSWLQALGVDSIVLEGTSRDTDLTELLIREEHAVRTQLLAVPAPLSPVRWPGTLIRAPNLDAAFDRVATNRSTSSAVVTSGVEHDPDGRIDPLHFAADLIEVEVSGGGGLLVLQRAYWPILRARSDKAILLTQPVDVGLTGIEVPTGSHRVTLDVDHRPVQLAGLLSVAVSLLALWIGFCPTRRLAQEVVLSTLVH